MAIQICKWYQDALAPVAFGIDDFCNTWVNTSRSGFIELGEDWGYAKRQEKSSLVFLEREILDQFPDVKVTFFVPMGPREMVVKNSDIPFISQKLNSDPESIAFFKTVANNPRYEIAYHGTTHGISGTKTEDFVQEWETFNSLDEAKKTIADGRGIYKEVFGVFPGGGKYCGFLQGRFGDESIDQSGFQWWCRYCNFGLYEYDNCTFGGDDYNPLTNFDLKYFGTNQLLDIPVTLNGGCFTDLYNARPDSLKGLAKSKLKSVLLKRKLKKIDYLLKHRLVINIQEHMAPSRNDGRTQRPNIFDDLRSLQFIFNYLKPHQLWYCTCTELADYAIARDHCFIEMRSFDEFVIRSSRDLKEECILSLKTDNIGKKTIQQPDGKVAEIINDRADVTVMTGIYKLI